MKPIVVQHRDLMAVMEHAKRYLKETPAIARLPGSSVALTDGQQIGLAYLNATLTILNTMGIPTDHVKIVFDDSEHSPT